MSQNLIPPQNLDAEEAVLGSCMLDPGAAIEAINVLPHSGYFYARRNQVIYGCILELFENGKEIDLLTVTEILKQKNEFEKVGGSEYLVSLLNVMPTSANTHHYAEIIREKTIRRGMIHAGIVLKESAQDEEKSIEEIHHQLDLNLMGLDNLQASQGFRLIKERLTDVYEDMTAEESPPGEISTGIDNLDSLMGNMKPGQLIIMAGRPGMGKSALVTEIAKNVCKKGSAVAFSSLEMTEEEIVYRLISNLAGIDHARLTGRGIYKSEIPAILQALQEISGYELFIDDSSFVSMTALNSKIRKLRRQSNIDLYILDYLQLMEINGQENRNNELGYITRRLKAWAKDLNMPIICLSQLSRKCEERHDHRPMLSDLRDSGAIEQDANIVIFPFRPGYYEEKAAKEEPFASTREPNRACELIVAKNRGGKTGTAMSMCWLEYMRFRDMADSQDYENVEVI